MDIHDTQCYLHKAFMHTRTIVVSIWISPTMNYIIVVVKFVWKNYLDMPYAFPFCSCSTNKIRVLGSIVLSCIHWIIHNLLEQEPSIKLSYYPNSYDWAIQNYTINKHLLSFDFSTNDTCFLYLLVFQYLI